MGKLLNVVDGYKRIIMVIFFVLASVASMATGQDYRGVVDTLFGILGWDPADAVVSAAVVASFVAAAWAVVDGFLKTRAAKKNEA